MNMVSYCHHVVPCPMGLSVGACEAVTSLHRDSPRLTPEERHIQLKCMKKKQWINYFWLIRFMHA